MWKYDWYSHIFQELFYFWVVFRLDLIIVEEILLFTFMFHELEAMAIKSVFILVSSNIVDNDIVRDVRTLIIVWLAIILVRLKH